MFRRKDRDLDVQEALVKFLTLKDEDVPAFRTRYPDFAPAQSWDLRTLNVVEEHDAPAWKTLQEDLRTVWDQRWSQGKRVGLAGMQHIINHVYVDDMFSPDAAENKIAFADAISTETDRFGVLKGFSSLNAAPWHARTCGCGKRFIADHPNRVFCSNDVDVCPHYQKVFTERYEGKERKETRTKQENNRYLLSLSPERRKVLLKKRRARARRNRVTPCY